MEKKVLEAKIATLEAQISELQNDAVKYHLLKETAGFAILTLQGYIFADCNAMATKIFGLTRAEIIGKEPFILSPKYQPDGQTSQEKAIALMKSALQGKPRRFEWEHLRGDGSRFYADVSLNKITVANEELIQVMLRDISEEKLSKERLENQNKIIRHLNKKYQRQNEAYEKLVQEISQHQELTTAILSAINDGVAVFYPDHFLFINDQMLFMLGETDDTLTPEHFFGLLGYDLNEMVLPAKDQVQYETWPKNLGEEKFFRLQIVPMSKPGIYLAHLADYTQIKKVHQSVEESEFKFRSIFHSSTDGILLISADNYMIMEANTTFEKNYGYKALELLGVNIDSLFYREQATKFIQWLEDNADDRINLTEFEIFSANGNISPVELGCRKIKLGEHNIFLLIVRDIAYRKHFEQQLLQSTIEAEEQERKRIAANLHDELGPVLSSMKLYNNTIKSKADEKLQYVSEQFKQLITEAVDTVRLVYEDLSPVTVYKGGLEKAIQKRISPLFDFFEVEYHSTISEIRFDETVEINLYRVINELINNSMKHAKASKITLKILYAKSGLNIHYSDNGKGFDQELTENSESGMGVNNLKGRLKSLNATYKFFSAPQHGVRYDIKIPPDNLKKNQG